MVLRKYSKSSLDMFKIKEYFFSENDELVQESMRQAEFYKTQPRRICCKNCAAPLEGDPLFIKLGIDYFQCERCHHLNGGYEDTEEFARHIYLGTESDYGKYYRPLDKSDYLERMQVIYEPKAEFMMECLRRSGEEPKTLSYCDIGAGSGYFVYALTEKCGLKNVIGYEVSPDQVDTATNMLGPGRVLLHDMRQLSEVLDRCDADVVSMIGVLEHLRDPRQILGCIRDNLKIKYLYLLVPMFSSIVFSEIVNPMLYSRNLTVDHTHLYTKESIACMCREYGFQSVGEWYFGSDIMDLYRFVHVQMACDRRNEPVRKLFAEKFKPIIDDLQAVLDKHELCSDAHILLKIMR